MNIIRRRRPRQGISSPVIAEDAYWQQQTQWGAARVDTAAFAQVLGISTAALHKLLARDDQFPQPMVAGRPNLWSFDQVYTYTTHRRPKQAAQIPRIYHRGDSLMPATWIAAERHTPSAVTGQPKPWIVHIWQPADDRGPVAVAYSDDALGLHTAARWAPRLLEVLDSVAAVAVITDELQTLRSEAATSPLWQATIVVADRQAPGGAVIQNYGWFDLANLLRVNLPWWPVGLRRLDDIQAWRPGAAPQSVRPSAPFFDENILHRLLAEAADPEQASQCRGVVDIVNARLEAEIYDGPEDLPDVPGNVERPGLFQAAFPRHRYLTPPQPPTLGELHLLMNLTVPSEAARQQAVELLALRSEVRAMVGMTVRTSERDGPLARTWISRLKRCDDPQTLGAMFACRTFTDEQRSQSHRWWHDELADFGWIAQTADGEYHATVGTQMPAIGKLEEFEVESGWHAAFYRASGTVWPMPLGGQGYYTCGYNGTGPDNLIAAITELRIAANAVLPDSSDTRAAPAALKHLIRTSEAPLTVTAAELAEVMSDVTSGTADDPAADSGTKPTARL